MLPQGLAAISALRQRHPSHCVLLSFVVGRSNRQNTAQQEMCVLSCSLLHRQQVLECIKSISRLFLLILRLLCRGGISIKSDSVKSKLA